MPSAKIIRLGLATTTAASPHYPPEEEKKKPAEDEAGFLFGSRNRTSTSSTSRISSGTTASSSMRSSGTSATGSSIDASSPSCSNTNNRGDKSSSTNTTIKKSKTWCLDSSRELLVSDLPLSPRKQHLSSAPPVVGYGGAAGVEQEQEQTYSRSNVSDGFHQEEKENADFSHTNYSLAELLEEVRKNKMAHAVMEKPRDLSRYYRQFIFFSAENGDDSRHGLHQECESVVVAGGEGGGVNETAEDTIELVDINKCGDGAGAGPPGKQRYNKANAGLSENSSNFNEIIQMTNLGQNERGGICHEETDPATSPTRNLQRQYRDPDMLVATTAELLRPTNSTTSATSVSDSLLLERKKDSSITTEVPPFVEYPPFNNKIMRFPAVGFQNKEFGATNNDALQKTESAPSARRKRKRRVCKYCNKSFSTRGGLEYHMNNKVCITKKIAKKNKKYKKSGEHCMVKAGLEVGVSRSKYSCKYCAKTFITELGVKYHEKNLVCRVAKGEDKTWKRKVLSKREIKKLSDSKSAGAEENTKIGGRQQSDTIDYITVVSNSNGSRKKFVCKYCYATFYSELGVQYHLKNKVCRKK